MPTFSLGVSQQSPNKEIDSSSAKITRIQSRKGKEPIDTSGIPESVNQENETVNDDVNDVREERTKSKIDLH